MLRARFLLAPLAPIAIVVPAQATVYLTVEEAQQAIFPGESLAPANVHLSEEQRKAIEKASGVRVRNRDQRVWKVAGGGWLIVDEVLGKHEFITYALGLLADGSVKQVEIMEYRETYGYEIRNAAWRAQFVGKTSHAKLKLDDDIRNISGATLSCRHITDGVKRLLAFYDVALR
jgi:Na+-transporting NADH:ubiquinone oxidoreductase subunit NqrC